jgi:exosortase/archaeosortase family protein
MSQSARSVNGYVSTSTPHSTGWFALRFFLIFALLTGAFELARGTAFERFVVEDLVLKPSVVAINALLPNDTVSLNGRTLSTDRSSLRITRGCEGIEILLMLAAGMLAFPANWKHRLIGLAWGALLSELLSVSRIVALHYTLRHHPQAWESLHGLILPLAPIALVGIFYLRWTAATNRAGSAEVPDAA